MGQLRQVDAFENHRQTAPSNLDGRDAFFLNGKSEGAGFQTPEPYCETVAVPVQYLQERTVAIQKDEQMTGQRIVAEFVADDADQSVERLAHVDGRRAKRNARVGRYGQKFDERLR